MVWSERQSLQAVYLKPLRSAIVYSRMYCQSLIDNPEESMSCNFIIFFITILVLMFGRIYDLPFFVS